MPLLLGAVADDYTGASDLAGVLSNAGLATIQTIGIPDADFALPEVDAVVAAFKIRSVPATEAVRQARAADGWLRAHGAQHVIYKICSTFDSTDAGNIGPVMDALCADHRQPIALVTPAFPENARAVFQGYLFVGTTLLSESSMKDHPLNPMRDSSLVRVLQRQSRGRVGLVNHACIAQGPDAVRARLAALVQEGTTAAIADAIDRRDLEVLGAVAAEHPVSIGASGLGYGLATALRASQGRAKAVPQADAPRAGPALCLAGSCSAATLAQIAEAEKVMPVLRLDADALVGDPSAVERALAWGRERIGRGPILIASSAAPESVAATQARHGRDAAGHAIEQAMARIAEYFVGQGVGRLIVAGGETSGAVVEALGIRAFRIGAEIAPGVPALEVVGRPGVPMRLALKSGNFGAPSFFGDALRKV